MLPNDERKIHLHLTDAFGVEGGKPDFEESMPEPGLFELTSPPGCCNLHNALWAAYQIAKGDAKPSTGALLVQSVKDFLSEVPPSAKSQAGHAMVVTLTQELPKSALSPEQGLRFASAVGDAVAQAVGPQQDGEGDPPEPRRGDGAEERPAGGNGGKGVFLRYRRCCRGLHGEGRTGPGAGCVRGADAINDEADGAAEGLTRTERATRPWCRSTGPASWPK